MKFPVKHYKTEYGNSPLKKYLEDLKNKNKIGDLAQIRIYITNLQNYGFDINKKFAPEAIKKIEGKLYELRPGSNRVLFFYYSPDGEFILLHGFKKKTQKTPKKQKNKAIKEMKYYKRRRTNEIRKKWF